MLPPAEFAHPMGRSGCRSCHIERDQMQRNGKCACRSSHEICTGPPRARGFRKRRCPSAPGAALRGLPDLARPAARRSRLRALLAVRPAARPALVRRLRRCAGPRCRGGRGVPALPAPAAALCAGTQRRRLRRHLARDRARAQVRRASRAGAAAGRADARGRRHSPRGRGRRRPRAATSVAAARTGDSIRPTISPASWACRSCGCCGGGATGGRSPLCRPAGGAPTCADRLRFAAARPASAGRVAPAFARGSVLVLVDDVMTTGATLDDCSRALLEAGAGAVRALTAARAVAARPLPPQPSPGPWAPRRR